MSGGPLLPSSIYYGAASGNVSPTYYTPATNTNNAGYMEGSGVVASLGSDAAVTLQFNLPESIPTGTMKLRMLAWANATSGAAKVTVSDAQTAPGSNIGATTLTAESQATVTWTVADVIQENKVTLSTTPAANDILTCLVTFNTSGWTLAAQSVWQFSLVWE